MKAALRVFARDLQRSWLPLVAFVGVALLIYLLAVRVDLTFLSLRVDSSGLESGNWLGFFVLYLAFGVSIVSSVTQADAALGETEFWKTRPISSFSIFLAKLFSAGLVFSVIVGAHGLFLLSRGVLLSDLVSGIGAMLPKAGAGCFCGLLLAACTRGLAKFWSLLIALSLCWIWFRDRLGIHGLGSFTNPWRSADLVVAAILATIATVFVYRQRSRVAVLLAVAIVVLGSVICAVWGNRVAPKRAYQRPELSLAFSSVSEKLNRSTEVQRPRRTLLAEPSWCPEERTVLHLVPVGQGQIRWSNGKITSWVGSSPEMTLGEAELLEAALGSGFQIHRQVGRGDSKITIDLAPNASDYRRQQPEPDGFQQAEPERYDGVIPGEILSYFLLGRTPLVAGATLQQGGCRFTLLQIPNSVRSRRIIARYECPREFDRQFDRERFPLVAVVNASRREAYILLRNGIARSRELGLPGLEVSGIAWSFDPKDEAESGWLDLSDEWLKDAEVLAFAERHATAVTLRFAFQKKPGQSTWRASDCRLPARFGLDLWRTWWSWDPF